MTNSWESRKKEKRPLRLIIFAGIVLLFAGILVLNNFEVFLSKKDTADVDVKAAKSEREEKKVAEEEVEEQSEEGEKETARADTSESGSSKEDTEPAQEDVVGKILTLDMPSVKCVLADKKGLYIQVSLKFYFKGKELEKEILFKRDNITLMVKKVFVKKYLSEIVVDELRAELKKEVNALLEHGKIEDVEFLDFKPIKE